MIKYRVSQEFSPLPGGLFKSSGSGSAEAFRDDVMYPIYLQCCKYFTFATFIFDTVQSPDWMRSFEIDGIHPSRKTIKEPIYSDAWLDEAFGGFIRKYHELSFMRRIGVYCSEDDTLLPRVKMFVNNAIKEVRQKWI